jgi:Na+/H+ antiporter NhaD/arsenite permease-like protein
MDILQNAPEIASFTAESGIAIGTFVGVVALLLFDVTHLTIAAMLGAILIVLVNVMNLSQAIGYIGQSHSTLALFFGIMVLVRSFEPTKVFDWLAVRVIKLTKGNGTYLLLAVVALTTVFSAFIPNATTVILLAPVIPPIAAILAIDAVPLLILMVITANSAGLLTFLGDPVNYIVGERIGLNFIKYMQTMSLSGVVAIITLLCFLPLLFRDTWGKQLGSMDHLPDPQINHPRVLICGCMIVGLVLVVTIVGENFPVPIAPATVALAGALLALILSHHSRIDTVPHILRDVDWSTLIFFMGFFVMVGSLEKTGVVDVLSEFMVGLMGKNIALACIVLVLVTGVISSVAPNIPLVVAMVPLVREYINSSGLGGGGAVVSAQVLPLYYSMAIGASLGGNGTLAGASANIVAAGIAESHNLKISFQRFLIYGVPITLAQLATACLFVGVAYLRG